MDEKYIIYATNMDEIGDKIISSSKECFYYNKEMISNPKVCIELGYKGVEKYRECLSLLKSIEVPDLVKNKHDKIIREWKEFIHATESEYITIDEEADNNFILKVVKETVSLQWKVSANTSKLCEQICDELVK
ncbi:hypothetical protein CLPUN_39090 [Clostridium puniceum]|uniref:Uncharacterized protein n=1 Tax=Clostridium puniceum TaxID=29367 RepID=A0A1S8T9M8_9CLOT|nr:hypothetical protein [Clostridium puniceum]OOM74456.1 hypothetical protein CLPUN_39090 [Clostridium puniceum]